MAERFSRHGIERALEPAVALARAGFVLPPKARNCWMADWPDLSGDAAEQFRLAVPFANPHLAMALEHAAAGTFSSGPVARSAGAFASLLAAVAVYALVPADNL